MTIPSDHGFQLPQTIYDGFRGADYPDCRALPIF